MKGLSSVVLVLTISVVYGKVTFTKFEDCDPDANYPIKMKFNLKEEGGKQIVEEGSVSSTIPLGHNIIDVADVYIKENGEYEHLITIKETVCDAVNKYMGEFMHDMQVAAGLEAGACPVPAGDYKITDHVVDFEKFKFKRIPEGDFRVIVNLFEANTNETLNCHNMEFSVEKD